MIKPFDRLWHQKLGRPYRLAKAIDTGSGTPVILLHGVGRTGQTWQYVVQQLQRDGLRVVAYDLLGFGASPKPDWLDYSIDDHAAALLASLQRLKSPEPVVLVGHSMGCLVAVRAARLRPDLVRHLVLYEMPLYEGLPQKRRYRLRTNLYFKFYEAVTRYQPTFNADTAKLAERLANRITGVEVDASTWQPFIRSLQNSIMKQTAADDIKQLPMPMDVIYGSMDMFVIRGKPQQVFGTDGQVTAHTIRARHIISKKASHFLVERIETALQTTIIDGPAPKPKRKPRRGRGK